VVERERKSGERDWRGLDNDGDAGLLALNKMQEEKAREREN
jgi:hypothetical protein